MKIPEENEENLTFLN